MKHARGEFDVKMTPVSLAGPAEDTTLGRFSIEKEYRGDLVGSGRGQMLTAMTEVEGSAAYVAIERVTGVLEGRGGGVPLHHRSEMKNRAHELYAQAAAEFRDRVVAGGTGEVPTHHRRNGPPVP